MERIRPRPKTEPSRRLYRRTVYAIPFAAILTMTACGSPADRDPPADSLGGTATVGVPASATTPLPPLAAAALDFELGALLYPGLNVGEWKDGGLGYRMGHPDALAASWVVEGPRLTYRLDASQTWSDGEPIGAKDVLFTFELLADTTLALPLSSAASRIDSITTPDSTTVVFHFDAPYPGMLFDTGVGILPEHVFGAVSRERFAGGLPLPDGMEPSGLPVSGPFRLIEWAPDDRIVFGRNDAAHDPARLDRLVVRVIPDEGTRAAELSTGRIQAAQFNSYRILRQVSNDGAVIHRIPQRGYDYVAWNPDGNAAFADPRVREALSLAIDRSALILALDLEGFGEPAWGPYGSLFEHLRSAPPHEPLHDPERATTLLAQAGFGEPASLKFELAVPSGNDRREDAAEIIQAQLAELGIVVSVRPQEFNSLLGRMMAGDYEAALMGWQVALDPDISPFWGDPASPLNIVDFDDPGVRTAIMSALEQPTGEMADPFWREAGEGLAAAYPYSFLWYIDIPFATQPALRNVSVDVIGWAGGARRWTVR